MVSVYTRRHPQPKRIPKRYAVCVVGAARPITEHTSISNCLDHARDVLRQGAKTVSITKLQQGAVPRL